MFLSSITLFLPALTGLFLRRYRPVIAYRIGRFLNPIAVGKETYLMRVPCISDFYLLFSRLFSLYSNLWQ